MKQVARLLRVHLGSTFDPKRDWTSDLRERAGYAPAKKDSSVSPFTLGRADTTRRMTDFVIEYGVSQNVGWQERLRATSTIYHVDVLVSGDTMGKFVMEAKWLERVSCSRLLLHRKKFEYAVQKWSKAVPALLTKHRMLTAATRWQRSECCPSTKTTSST